MRYVNAYTLSIVIATRNSLAQLADARARWAPVAALAQIVVQDGASDDGSLSLLQELRGEEIIHSLCSEPDKGPYDAWNRALERCTGDWILFYGDADVAPVEWLRALRQMSPEECDVVTGELSIRNARGIVGKIDGWVPGSRQAIFNETLLPHVGMAHSKLLFVDRRFDATFRIAGDREFLLRAWPFRAARVSGISQGSMLLGGLSNAPAHSELASLEDQRLLTRFGLSETRRRRVVRHAKDLLRRFPGLWRTAHELSLRARGRGFK